MIFPSLHDRAGDQRVPHQRGFDFPDLDAEPTNLHLGVHTTDEVDGTVGQPACQIPCSVDALLVRLLFGEGMSWKLSSRDLGPAQVAPRQTRPAETEFPNHTNREQVQGVIEYVSLRIEQGLPDGQLVDMLGEIARNQVSRRRDGALGRTITVDDPYPGQGRVGSSNVADRDGLATDDELAQPLETRRVLVDEGVEERNGYHHRGHAVTLNDLRHAPSSGDRLVVQCAPSSGQERHPDVVA